MGVITQLVSAMALRRLRLSGLGKTSSTAFAKTFGTCLAVALAVGFGESPLHAQQTDSLRQSIGEWRAHLSFSETIDAAACASFTAWATTGGVVLRYNDSGEIRRLDKTNALSQGRVRRITCDPERDGRLVVVYEDGALEVIEDERSVYYLTAIPNARIPGRRNINGVQSVGESLFVVAADFGYVLFDANEGVFLDDVRLPERVYDAAVLTGDLYLATDAGLLILTDYRGRRTLRDVTQYTNLDGVLTNAFGRCLTVETFGDEVYAGFNDRLYAVAAGGASSRIVQEDGCVDWVDLDAAGGKLLALSRRSCDGGRARLAISEDGRAFGERDLTCAIVVVGAALAPSGEVAMAGIGPTYDGSALMLTEGPNAPCRQIALDGPRFSTVFDVVARDGVVAVAAGAISPNLDYTGNYSGVSELRQGRWTNFNDRTREILRDIRGDGSAPYDFSAVAYSDKLELYAGAYFEGVYRLDYKDPSLDERYDELNSSLNFVPGDADRVRIAGMTFDSRGNLWVANYGARQALSVRTAGGEWFSYDLRACGSDNKLRRIALVERFDGSVVVYATDAGNGLIVFDPKGTLADPSDDVCRALGTSSGLPDVDLSSVVTDREGQVWVGTVDGIATINCPDPSDAERCRASTPQSEAIVDGIQGLLFEDSGITALAVDGGNRKWVGTNGGLFLIDDATNNPQLATYTKDNSPLLSNEITALSYDGSTGLLWIGTSNGLVSLQTGSSTGNKFTHAAEVEIFPQPVRPDYDGPITMRGFAQDSNVKITDTQGRLVYEVRSTGGTAVWDGRDYTGQRAVTGVYFVWATATQSQTKPATVVGKIALVR